MANSGMLLETVAFADARTISEALKALPAASEQQTPIEVVAANRVVSLLEERHLLQAELNQLREEKAHPPGSDALAEASDRSSAQSILHAPAVSPRASYETQEAVWKELQEMKSMIVRLQEELHMSFASSNEEASRVNHVMQDEMKVLQEQIQSKDTCNENLLRTIHIMSDSYLKHLQSSIASSRKERFNAISGALAHCASPGSACHRSPSISCVVRRAQPLLNDSQLQTTNWRTCVLARLHPRAEARSQCDVAAGRFVVHSPSTTSAIAKKSNQAQMRATLLSLHESICVGLREPLQKHASSQSRCASRPLSDTPLITE